MSKRIGKIIPKEIILPIIQRLQNVGVEHENNATWTNIYNNTIGESGKRYATNDISCSIEYYLEKNMIEEKPKNKKTKVFFLGCGDDLASTQYDEYDDFLKKVAEVKKQNLEKLVANLEDKQIFTKNKQFVQKNHEDYTKFIVALEDICQFYTNLLYTRENSDYDDNVTYDIFNENITYVIKLVKKTIEECCMKLKYNKEEDEKIMINGMLDNITWFLKV